MYLTRFEINTARRGARELLSSAQKLHAAVLAGFPPSQREPEADGRVLWRIDQHQHSTALYIASPYRPDLTHLVESAGWPSTHGWDTRSYLPLLDALTEGDQWHFRLTANPVHAVRKSPDEKRGRRCGHVTGTQQTQWLLDRAERSGFTISVGQHDEPDVAVRDRRTERFSRKGRTVTLSTATFEGTLVVTDPKTLRHSLAHGIGPAKGFGCGLLTLAR